MEAAVLVGLAQALDQARAQDVHGVLFQPAVREQAQHQDDLRPVGLGQTLFQRRRDPRRREVLVLDVQRLLCRRDHVEIELLHLLDRGQLAARRCGARDADLDALQVGRERRGPRVVVAARTRARDRRLQLLAGGPVPALARQRREAARGFAVEHHHQVVERRVGLAVRHAPRILRQVLRAIPAAHGEVDAADEGERIVDDDDLLVMRARHRMRVVVAQVHAPGRRPAEAVERREFPIGAEHHRVIPVEHVDVQRMAASDQVVEEIADQRRRTVRLHRVEVQPRLAVEIPAEDGDRVARAQRRLVERLEVIGGVDDQRHAVGARHRPAVVAGPQQRRRVRLAQVRRGCRGAVTAPAHAAIEIEDAAHELERQMRSSAPRKPAFAPRRQARRWRRSPECLSPGWWCRSLRPWCPARSSRPAPEAAAYR